MNSGRIQIIKQGQLEIPQVHAEDSVICIGMPNLEGPEDIFLTDLFIRQMMDPVPVVLSEEAKADPASFRLFLYLTFRHPTALRAWSEFYQLSYETMKVGPAATIKDLAVAFKDSKVSVECQLMLEMLK